MTDRTAARVVGVLFIIASVAGLIGLAVQQPVVDAEDYLARAPLEPNRMATGALLELIMAVAVVGIAVAIYPILRRGAERLALGYVAARSIEAVIYVIDTILLLTLLSLGRELANTGADAPSLRALGAVVLAGRDWGGHAILDATAFSMGAVILNYALYRARLVPRWLSVWGLLGAAACLAAGTMVLYGLEAQSTTQVVLDAPLGVQEMVLAVWLIVRGFGTSAPVAAPVRDREPIAVGS